MKKFQPFLVCAKTLSAYIGLFLMQFICSCIPCDCSDVGTYEMEYTDVDLTAWDTSGFSISQIYEDSVYRNSFGLTIYVQTIAEKIACSTQTLGFSTAHACSCDDNEYLYVDPISEIKVFVTDIDTGTNEEITEIIGVHEYYSDELIELSESLIYRDDQNRFDLEFIEFDSLPNSAIFTVNVQLESGIVLSDETGEIRFYD